MGFELGFILGGLCLTNRRLMKWVSGGNLFVLVSLFCVSAVAIEPAKKRTPTEACAQALAGMGIKIKTSEISEQSVLNKLYSYGSEQQIEVIRATVRSTIDQQELMRWLGKVGIETVSQEAASVAVESLLQAMQDKNGVPQVREDRAAEAMNSLLQIFEKRFIPGKSERMIEACREILGDRSASHTFKNRIRTMLVGMLRKASKTESMLIGEVLSDTDSLHTTSKYGRAKKVLTPEEYQIRLSELKRRIAEFAGRLPDEMAQVRDAYLHLLNPGDQVFLSDADAVYFLRARLQVLTTYSTSISLSMVDSSVDADFVAYNATRFELPPELIEYATLLWRTVGIEQAFHTRESPTGKAAWRIMQAYERLRGEDFKREQDARNLRSLLKQRKELALQEILGILASGDPRKLDRLEEILVGSKLFSLFHTIKDQHGNDLLFIANKIGFKEAVVRLADIRNRLAKIHFPDQDQSATDVE